VNVRMDEQVMKLQDEHSLVDTERAIVKLDSGVIWAYLKQEDKTIGIAFHGQARITVDAIVETEYGASGESISADLEGIQLYFGLPELEEKSTAATQDDLTHLGYPNTQSLQLEVERKLKGDKANGKTRFDVDDDAGILIGEDSSKKKLVLVAKESSTIFTYDDQVFVLGKDNMVSVNDSRISIGGPHKKSVIIDEDGILGLEGLQDVGPAISRAVSSIIRTIPKVTRQVVKDPRIPDRRLHHRYGHGYAYDNVDEFDWDD
jgi:hypothetical protein